MSVARNIDIEELIKAETSLELQLINEPDFREGLIWGTPRFGHPEGTIVLHINEVLSNINKLPIDENQRAILRLVAISHDTFKNKEDRNTPRNWNLHHSILAKEFMSKYSSDPVLLQTIEYHDEPFYCWLHVHRGEYELAERRLNRLLNESLDFQMLYLFFICDTLTGDKILAPLIWLEEKLELESYRKYFL